jgi:hypothetical protein
MTNTYTLINSNTVGSGGAASVTFSSIPNTYTDLLLKYSMRTLYAGISNNTLIQFNSSGGTAYSLKALYGTGSAAASFGRSSGASTDAGYANGSTSTTNAFSNNDIYIPNYASTNYKSFSVDSVIENNATAADSMLAGGLWSSTSAITSITISDFSSNTIIQYSTFYLYGIKNS